MSEGRDFWSRRKARVEAEAQAEQAALARQAEIEAQRSLDEMSDEELCAHFELPDPDSLQLGDNVQAFMSRAVPERLRRRALRRLWRTNPVLACLDGLNDYDDDYTAAATAGQVFKTSYQVGKGMLKHIEYLAEQAEAAASAKAEAAPADDAAVEVAADTPPEAAPAQDMPEASQAAMAAAPEDAAAPATATRRRMRFAAAPMTAAPVNAPLNAPANDREAAL